MKYYVHTPDYKTFTLVEKDSGKEATTFTDAALFRGILNGDTVQLYDDRDPAIQLVVRAKHPTLSGVLVLNTKTIYGLTSRNVPIYLFHPFDRRYPPFRVGCRDSSRTNMVATVSFEEWEHRDTFPRGALNELLGPADSFAAQIAGLEVVASPFWSRKAFMGQSSHMEAPAGREMFWEETGWTVFNIDPAGCRDIDDAIAIRGNEFAICIADVDAAVPEGGRLDEYAALTGQTIYNDGVAVRPMLPLALSEGACSLVAGAVRPVVALRADIVDGTLRNVRFQAANIINGRSYTYEEAGGNDSIPYKLLVPVVKVFIEQQGGSWGAACPPCDDSHEWIAEAMKWYNVEAAKILVARGQGILRAHAGTKAERLSELEPVLGPDVAARLASEAAKYCLVASGLKHVGLGDVAYCHATSPIRRYADLVNQRILKGTAATVDHELIYTLNVRGKAAKEYERACAFMRALEAPVKEVDVILVGGGRAYVPAWGRMIKYAGGDDAKGKTVRVRYYYDATKTRWSEKMVFETV